MEHRFKPSGAWLTVNRGCNFRCAGCYALGTGYKTIDDITLDFAVSILYLVQSLGIRQLFIIGGEPTLWKSLLDFNRVCASRGMKTTLVTNAMRFGADDFWAEYQTTPNTSLGISIKAYNESSLQEIAQVSAFEKIECGVRRGLALLHGGVSAVLGANTKADHMIRMARFAIDCGARSFGLSPCTPSFHDGIVDDTAMMHPRDVVQYVVEAYPEIDQITQGRFMLSAKTPLCIWPRDFIETLIAKRQLKTVCQLHKHAGVVFATDGNALMCNSLFDYPVGKFGVDFMDAESLLALLNGDRTSELYRPLISYASEKCATCPKHSECAAGCPLFWTVYDPKDIIVGW